MTLAVISGLPIGATMTPVLPVAGPASGVSSVFNWTPSTSGVFTITYSVTDNHGASVADI